MGQMASQKLNKYYYINSAIIFSAKGNMGTCKQRSLESSMGGIVALQAYKYALSMVKMMHSELGLGIE